MVKSDKISTEQRGAIQEHCYIADTNRLSALADQVRNSRELRTISEAFVPIHASTESHAFKQHVRTKSTDDDPGILRGESKTSRTPHRIVRTSLAPSRTTLLLSGSPIGTTSSTPDAPLAVRRGKSLSRLKLKGSVIEHLEYPDIPTAFRGSPVVWSPRFDTFPVRSFTDHESMLLDLKSKCVALGNGMSAYVSEPPRPQTKLTCASLGGDEWAFTRELVTLDEKGLIDSQVPREVIADTSVFLPDDASTPLKDPSVTARLGPVPRIPSAPVPRSPRNHSNHPPGVPLPPRPALINPSTPPYVRGILKKVKNVRFEDATTKEFQNRTSPVVSPPASPERPSPLPSAVSPERPCTPTPATAKPSISPPPLKEALARDIQKKSAARPRPPPKRAKANENLDPVRLKVSNAPEPSKPTLVTKSAERPCRITHVKENTNPTPASRLRAKQKGLSIPEIDVRRGIEGTTKSRLSTPLRNIFRFR